MVNIAKLKSTMPTSTLKTESTLFKRLDIFESEKVSPKKASPQRQTRQSNSSITRGKKVKAQIKTPQMPTDDFKMLRDAVTVVRASASTPPATGTVEPTINFAVLTERVSADEFTAV